MKRLSSIGILCSLALCVVTPAQRAREAAPIIIHEIAWMGTTVSAENQWLELYNAGNRPVSLNGWILRNAAGEVDERLSGTLEPGHTYVVARTSESFLPGIRIHHEMRGALSPDGDILTLFDAHTNLVDRVDRWHAGSRDTAATMQRVYPYRSGDDRSGWKTATVRYDAGYGTPGFRLPPDESGQMLYQVFHGPDTLNIFFNQSALTELALAGNEANHRINLEERIIDRMRQARERIDLAVYELNLPDTIDTLIAKAAEGVQVRVLIDAKAPSDYERDERYRVMRAHLERMARGRDGKIGTTDDVHLFANSPIFAVTDPHVREQYGLPRDPAGDLPFAKLLMGRSSMQGHLLVEGGKREEGIYYAPGGQMHNKFAVIDDYRVLTGSMNFTETGIYGTSRDRLSRRIQGNSNNLLDIHSRDVAAVYRAEFNQMWGSPAAEPDPREARFRSQKARGQRPHEIMLGDIPTRVYFSPGYDVIPAITDFVEHEARESVYFCIFSWSDSDLENTIKRKWEQSSQDLEGELTGFRVKGVFERIFWNQWWSANINMLGREAKQVSVNNPNIRWRHHPPVFMDREQRKLHHKYMLVDADTTHNPTVITGSANWSRNANEVNDENTIFIHDARIANQYLQEFFARYQQAGGDILDAPIPSSLATRDEPPVAQSPL